jgi:hypothetical protein
VLGHPLYTAGSPNVDKFLREEMEDITPASSSGSRIR